MNQIYRIFICFLLPVLGIPALAFSDNEIPLISDAGGYDFSTITDIVDLAIIEGKIPGAVIVVGNQDKVLYKKAFGFRSLKPEILPMTDDTIFDIASITKVVATTTAIMQLVEKGKINIDDPVYRYWPEFKAHGKKGITVRHLLTHYSGLRANLRMKPYWSGYKDAMDKIICEKPKFAPGKHFIYSDINFQILGELVRRVSGKSLNQYSDENIFGPLGMKDTGFNPDYKLKGRIAPTEYLNGNDSFLWGVVHDPAAQRMGGVAGHAGVFSTALDLSVFAKMILNNGIHNDVKILSAESINQMTTPQSPDEKKILRGLGWDIDSPFSCNRGEIFPIGSFGHTGYTGTSMWIDPFSKTYVIVLTNRVHPDGKGDAKGLYKEIATAVAWIMSGKNAAEENKNVRAGIDVLSGEDFLPLSGLRVGLITNYSGLNSKGERTINILSKAPDVKLIALFSPEHGISGSLNGKIASTVEPVTGLPVHSLYGDTQNPTDVMLDGIDALVFDIQDAGARFYTYITTMAYAMEAAAKKGIPFYVLDRPNPITASVVQGPVMDSDLKSFTGYFPLPIRHGMTAGELARMFNEENKIGADLHVITMQGYERAKWYDETGLRWVRLSPNLRSLTEAVLYPGVALVEGSNVSVGRGTDTPFEIFGAPWITSKKLAAYLNRRNIKGVKFVGASFVPKDDSFKRKKCHGVKVVLLDRNILDVARLGIEIVSALYRLYPEDFQIDKTLWLIGSRDVLQAIKKGKDPKLISLGWQDRLEEFLRLRSKYLLY